ncbi:MAG TPA: AAA family ATPase [Gaiellaceae bacterium]|nr:AAA family ATPase [Gaiellaceae bacterium]
MADTRRATITWADEVEEDIAEFLVPKRVPRGALTLLAGMPDKGKTLWLCEIAACITRGDFGDEPARVLITSTEDSIATTLRPRLRAAGADLTKVGFVSMQVKDEDAGLIRFPDDVEEFRRIIEEGDFRLAIIDPILGHINSNLIASFKDEQLRDGLMTPLAQIAAENDCAVIGCMHFNKRSEGEALLRVSGSLGGIVGPARSVLFMHESPDNDAQRILTHEKCNLGPKGAALLFEIDRVPLEIKGRTVPTAHLRFVDESSYTGADLLSGKADTPAAVAAAVEFFQTELADSPRPSKELRAAAREIGISNYAWDAAKARLGIVARKTDFGGGWTLDLPMRITVRSQEPGAGSTGSSIAGDSGSSSSSDEEPEEPDPGYSAGT